MGRASLTRFWNGAIAATWFSSVALAFRRRQVCRIIELTEGVMEVLELPRMLRVANWSTSHGDVRLDQLFTRLHKEYSHAEVERTLQHRGKRQRQLGANHFTSVLLSQRMTRSTSSSKVSSRATHTLYPERPPTTDERHFQTNSAAGTNVHRCRVGRASPNPTVARSRTRRSAGPRRCGRSRRHVEWPKQVIV
jgi:hypothetical protein